MSVLLWLLAVVLVMVGIAGTLLPMLPGMPLVFLGLLVAAWIDQFTRVGWITLLLLAALTVLSLVIDFVAATLGAKRAGAGRAALIGAGIGAVVGIFFGLPGLLIGPFLGAAAGQLFEGKTLAEAGRAGLGTWLGFLLGSAAKLILALAMIGVFIGAWLA